MAPGIGDPLFGGGVGCRLFGDAGEGMGLLLGFDHACGFGFEEEDVVGELAFGRVDFADGPRQ